MSSAKSSGCVDNRAMTGSLVPPKGRDYKNAQPQQDDCALDVPAIVGIHEQPALGGIFPVQHFQHHLFLRRAEGIGLQGSWGQGSQVFLALSRIVITSTFAAPVPATSQTVATSKFPVTGFLLCQLSPQT